MASMMRFMVNNYDEIIETRKDPMVDSWFLMSSPVPILSILGFYLYFVLKLGPQLMANRKAFNLQKILVAYNFVSNPYSLRNNTLVAAYLPYITYSHATLAIRLT
jgi:hypothetical protein